MKRETGCSDSEDLAFCHSQAADVEIAHTMWAVLILKSYLPQMIACAFDGNLDGSNQVPVRLELHGPGLVSFCSSLWTLHQQTIQNHPSLEHVFQIPIPSILFSVPTSSWHPIDTWATCLELLHWLSLIPLPGFLSTETAHESLKHTHTHTHTRSSTPEESHSTAQLAVTV